MNLCEKVAVDFIRKEIERNMTPEAIASLKATSCTPASDGQPVIWTYMGWPLYTDRAGDHAVKLKRGQIGVVLHWPERSEYRIFKVAQIWDDIVNPKPKQLPLWAEMEAQ